MKKETVEVNRAWFVRLLELQELCKAPINVQEENTKWAEMEANSRLNQLLGYVESAVYILEIKSK